ncbi:MAG TPA: flippase [Candidatus Moranbacteria bacterium]|nr:flippase [Candidatus Moranbacteria bacterium]
MSKHSLAKSTLWLVVSEIVFNLSGYVIHSAVARILGPADYGRYGLVVTLTTMVIILIGNGIPTAMAKYISEVFETDPALVLKIKRKAALMQSALIGAITLAFFLASPLISALLGDPTLTPLFRISALIIPAFAMASFYFSWYTGLHRFGIQSVLKVLRSILKVAAIVGLAWVWGVPGSVLGYALAAFGVFLVAFSLDRLYYTKNLKKAALAHPGGSQGHFPASKLASYAWQIIVFFLAYELLISIDLYLVKGMLRSDYLTGIYNAALTVGRIPYYVFYALTVMLLPVVSKHTARGEFAKASQIVSSSLRIMLILLVPAVVLMARFSTAMMEFFYGQGYAEAGAPMAILSYGVGFLTVFYILSFVLNGAGQTKKAMVIASVGFAVNTALNALLIPPYGITGSAVATSLTSVFVTVWTLGSMRRDYGALVRFSDLWRIALAAALTYGASLPLLASKFSFIPYSLALFAFYLFLLYLLGGISKEDVRHLQKMVSRKKTADVEKELSGNEPAA